MPQLKCKNCGRLEGKNEWFKSAESIEKCETCRKEDAEAEKNKAVALKEKELSIEKEKAVALKEKELSIEKEKAVALKEKELSIEKEKSALKEKELTIEKEKALALKEKELTVKKEQALAELASKERQHEKDLEYKKWEGQNRKAIDEESRRSGHEMKLKEMAQAQAAKKEEIELRTKGQLEVEKAKASALTKLADIETTRLKAEERRLELMQPIIQKMIEKGDHIDKIQSLVASMLIPSTNFQPAISVGDSLASKPGDKDTPEAYSDIGNVNENIEDSSQ